MGDHRQQDEIDTAKVVLRENTRVEFQSAMVHPGIRTQIEIIPEHTMDRPVLFMSTDPATATVHVEQVVVGHFVILTSPGDASDFKFGRPLEENVSANESIRIVVQHAGPTPVKVGASLVVTEKPGTYRISDRQLLNKG